MSEDGDTSQTSSVVTHTSNSSNGMMKRSETWGSLEQSLSQQTSQLFDTSIVDNFVKLSLIRKQSTAVIQQESPSLVKRESTTTEDGHFEADGVQIPDVKSDVASVEMDQQSNTQDGGYRVNYSEATNTPDNRSVTHSQFTDDFTSSLGYYPDNTPLKMNVLVLNKGDFPDVCTHCSECMR